MTGPGLEAETVRALADALFEAGRTRTAIEPLTTGALGKTDEASAYAVQQVNTDRALSAGRRLVGRKIGLTARSVQAQLGVDQPDYGMIFADMVLADADEIPADRLIQPRVEAEVALVLERDLDMDMPTIADVIRATAFAAAAIEVVDSRVAGWRITFADTVADNASSGLVVLGGGIAPLDRVDLRLCGMVMERAGEEVSTGVGAACLGHPLAAATWLARKAVATGRPLAAGDLIMTGALGPMVPARPGEVYEARISGLGTVRAAFAAGDRA
ncbi:MAG: fumarylacetoacetate hydrolase family protein [Azospirillaceae bacterium]